MKVPVLVALLVAGLLGLPHIGAPAVAASAPIHSLTVAGAGISMYPAFDPGVERYAITTADRAPALTVAAASSEAGSRVRINGSPAPAGRRVLSGLEAGDEIAVSITDSSGTAIHSLFVTPPGFPTLERADTGATSGDIAPGHVLLTLMKVGSTTSFEAIVDDNGVPVYAHEAQSSMDLKRQATGALTVSRRTTTPGRTGSAAAILDGRMREIARHETVGLVDTDSHDSLFLKDGSRYLIAYEPNPTTQLTDSVIQHIAADGTLLWQWSTADHVDPAAESVVDVATNPDYAHINSIELTPDGDVLASFRHFSAVFKIARHARDAVASGQIVWKLGGRDSDFTFVDERGEPLPGDGGPCAQHTASVVEGGRVLVFDNGSWSVNGGELCVDPSDPHGSPVPRVQSRVSEYALDTAEGTATRVWNYEEPDRFAIFAGSAERQGNGATLIGWASERRALATEIDRAGSKVWELVDASTADTNDRFFTYRATRTPVPDVTRPEVTLTGVTDGASLVEGTEVSPVSGCTDRGGASLRSCVVTGLVDGRLDTRTPGTRQVRVSATDGAGNATTSTRTYVVRPKATPMPAAVHQPDAAIRKAGSAQFRGVGKVGSTRGQTVKSAIRRRGGTTTFVVRVTNRGTRTERFRITGTAGSKRLRAAYRVAGTTRTKAVTRGSYRTPALRPGDSITVKVVVRRTASTPSGARRMLRIRASSTARSSVSDTVAAVVRAMGAR